MKNWTVLKDVIQVTALVTIAVSLLFLLIETNRENGRNARFLEDQVQREKELLDDKVFDELDLRYIEFLELCLNYIHLDPLDIPQDNPPELAPKEKEQQKALYMIVISLLERAHVSFQKDRASRATQWSGWDHYANNYISRKAFRDIWIQVEPEFDLRFQQYMNEKVNAYPEVTAPQVQPVPSPAPPVQPAPAEPSPETPNP